MAMRVRINKTQKEAGSVGWLVAAGEMIRQRAKTCGPREETESLQLFSLKRQPTRGQLRADR